MPDRSPERLRITLIAGELDINPYAAIAASSLGATSIGTTLSDIDYEVKGNGI